jgi:hypothetical protein
MHEQAQSSIVRREKQNATESAVMRLPILKKVINTATTIEKMRQSGEALRQYLSVISDE